MDIAFKGDAEYVVKAARPDQALRPEIAFEHADARTIKAAQQAQGVGPIHAAACHVGKVRIAPALMAGGPEVMNIPAHQR
ncbi:hypothetical protein GCM10009424_15310 [Sphingomonas ursincola]